MIRKQRNRIITAGVLALSGVLASECALGPDYVRPGVDVPKEWVRGAALPGDLEVHWWERLSDKRLAALEDRCVSGNLDLNAAAARVDRAHRLVDAVNAGLFPTLYSAASDSRFLRSRNLPTGITNGVPQPKVEIPLPTNNYAGGATVSNIRGLLGFTWDLDIWGRSRRLLESAGARAQAEEMDAFGLQLALTTELAESYFAVQAVDREIDIFARAVKVRQENYDMVMARFKEGVANQLEVAQAKTELDATRAAALSLTQTRRQLESSIAILMGEMPESFQLAAFTDIASPAEIPTGIPSDLIRRRPDVLEAEYLLVAANAEIGVAKANFFPSFTLTGYAGVESASLKSALRSESGIWGVSGGLSVPLFDWGRNQAILESAKSRHAETTALYKKRVISALAQVENALSAAQVLADEGAAIDLELKSSRQTFDLANLRYKEGLSSYLEVLDAQRTLLAAEREDVRNKAGRLSAMLVLIRSLGGGWKEETERKGP